MKFDILATRNNDAMFRMSKLLHLYDRKNCGFFSGKKIFNKSSKIDNRHIQIALIFLRKIMQKRMKLRTNDIKKK